MKKILVAILGALALFSCQNPAGNLTQPPVNLDGEGSLQFAVYPMAPWLTADLEGEARALLYVTSAKIWIKNSGGTDLITPVTQAVTPTGVGTPVILPAITQIPHGTNHTVTVELYNSAVGASAVLSGTTTFTLSAGEMKTVTVKPIPISPTALTLGVAAVGPSLALTGEAWYSVALTGSTEYDISLTAGANKAAYVFNSAGDFQWLSISQGTPLTFVPPTTGTYYIGVAGLEAGSFDLTVTAKALKDVILVSGTGSFNFGIDLGTQTKDVYFVFSNTSTGTSTTSQPTVTNMAGPQGMWMSFGSEDLGEIRTEIKGNPSLDTKTESILKNFSENPRPRSLGSPTAPVSRAIIGDAFTYKAESEAGALVNVPVTMRGQASNISTVFGNRTLNIWVANDCWETTGSTKTFEVTQAMVDILKGKFLQTGTGNDIYDWVAGIFGPEWGVTGYSDLISYTGTIDIVIYDIWQDNAVDGGVLGYYWAGNNFVKTSDGSATDNSNQKILFAIDAVLFASSDDDGNPGSTGDIGVWSTSDYWPRELISTLAHEFQHMIQFYQKAVVKNTNGLDTWINEMLSQLTEDLVADKILSDGPRGVNYNDFTAGSTGNGQGRLPLFNLTNYIRLNAWLDYGNPYGVLPNYSISYAFGAWLLRNYGGADLLSKIYDNTSVDHASITSAIQALTGETISAGDLIRKWGAAVILSSKTNAPSPYRYNSGGAWSYYRNGSTYNVGSINLFNYSVAPTVYTASPVGTGNMAPMSNFYYRAGLALTGSPSWNITLPDNVKLTVVLK